MTFWYRFRGRLDQADFGCFSVMSDGIAVDVDMDVNCVGGKDANPVDLVAIDVCTGFTWFCSFTRVEFCICFDVGSCWWVSRELLSSLWSKCMCFILSSEICDNLHWYNSWCCCTMDVQFVLWIASVLMYVWVRKWTVLPVTACVC